MRDLPSRYSEKQWNSGHSVFNCQLQPKACNPRTQRLFDQTPSITSLRSFLLVISLCPSVCLAIFTCEVASRTPWVLAPLREILRAQELDFEGPMAHNGLKFFRNSKGPTSQATGLCDSCCCSAAAAYLCLRAAHLRGLECCGSRITPQFLHDTARVHK